MAQNLPGDDFRARAETLLIEDPREAKLPPADREIIIEAVEADLRIASASPDSDTAARLAKVETQTRVLSDAVIAMTDQSDAVAPAIKAVKDEM